MRVVVIGLGLGLLAAPLAFADAKAGGDLYSARCNMCHGTGLGGAPAADKLKESTPESIIEKLTTGTMSAMAAGLSDADKRDIAVYLSGKGLPAAGDLPAVDPLPADTSAPAATGTPAPGSAPTDPAPATPPTPPAQ